MFALSCFSGDVPVCIQRLSGHGPSDFLLAANTSPALGQAEMGRKAGVSPNSAFPGGSHWFKADFSHHWDEFLGFSLQGEGGQQEFYKEEFT